MRNFVLGVIVTVAVLLLCGIGAALLGFVPMRANSTPPAFEQHLAMSAVDASIERHAVRGNNPLPPTDDNLITGLKLYTMNCAMCHGGIDRQPSSFAHSFYPPAPNLIQNPPDDPEWHIFFVIHNGIRYTGMPAWDKTLAGEDMWKITAFLTRMEKLPPAVQDYWRKAGGTPPAESGAEKHEDHP